MSLASVRRLPPTPEPAPRRFSLEEYYQLAELGWFRGQRVHLIDGTLYTMSPQNAPHANAIVLGYRTLERVFGEGYVVRVQMPLEPGGDTDPEPDLAVVRGDPRQMRSHPASALLVVEVADTTLVHDRGRKAELYASIGVADYWLVNLPARRLEVRRRPERAGGVWRYAEERTLGPGEAVAPLARPDTPVGVDDLLP